LPWDLSAAELALTITSVVVGALVQGAIGIGFGLVVVPALALIQPALLPAVPLLVSLPLTGLIAARERHAIDRTGMPLLLAGRVVGTAAAVWLLVALTDSALEILFGVVILGVAAISFRLPLITPSRTAKLLAASVSGLFATTAAIGGPPLALLYQRRPGPEVRSTLSMVFLLGGLLSLGGLVTAGRLETTHLLVSLLLAPAMIVGFTLSRPLARFLDRGWLRPAVLAFAAAGGLLAILRGLTG
jgi:uncharacterized protein